jgi:Ca-activated chloride channel family protein
MKRAVLLSLVWWLSAICGRADGLIIVHDPFVPPLPRPRPPFPPRPPIPWPPPHYAFAPLEVVFHHVEARIRDQVAVTAVDQEFYNPNERQLEGTYIFPVPKGAQLDRFSMDVGGKQVQAELLPADKARQIYEDIVRKFRDPALLEYAGQDVFKVRIFPIEPRSRKRIKLSYTQLLKADAGLVSYVYPLNTEKYSAKPIETVSLKLDLETKRPLKSIYSPSHNVEISRHGDNKATVGFEAKAVKPDTDFQLFYSSQTDAIAGNLMACRSGGEDGYFLLLAAPGFETKPKQIVAKDVAFVLDTSGSMAGKKLEQAKKALLFCVENLNEGDRFEVTRFATETEPLFNELSPATRANRDRAAAFINDLKAIGGTAIYDALRKILSARPEKTDRPYLIVFLTDGQPTVGETDPDKIVAAVGQAGGSNTRVFCFGIGHDVNTHLLDRITETTHATSAYVLPEEDLEVKVSNFFAKIKEPVLANVKLTFPDGARVSKLYPSALPDLFKGEELVLVGRYSGKAAGKLSLEGTVNGVPQKFAYDVQFPEAAGEHEFIPRLWATRRIGYLLDEIRLRGESAEVRDEVTELARKYGIVTPYTAYLIHEDEVRRQVPLAMQSLPQFQNDAAAFEATRQVYNLSMRDVSGQAAVAGARYGLSQKSANQVGTALAAGRAENENSMRMLMRYGLVRAPSGRTVAAPAATAPAPATGAATAAPVDVASQITQYTQQTRFVNGRNFFQNGNQWIDARVQKLPQAQKVRIQFNSQQYFDLLAKEPQVRPWLALGQNVQFALGEKVYEVYE